MIAVIDYGVGNLYSPSGSLAHLKLESTVTADPEVIRRADRILLPGVGAFGDAMSKLQATGLVPVILEAAAAGTPILGICLGMQLLFESSLEYGHHKGLGLIKGQVCPLAPDLPAGTKVPHMGWNALQKIGDHPLLRYVSEGDCVYYVHSFYAKNCSNATIATSDYNGLAVTGAVAEGNVYGTQFHPEKSGDVGLAILRAFAE